jgi:hypothetical protein
LILLTNTRVVHCFPVKNQEPCSSNSLPISYYSIQVIYLNSFFRHHTCCIYTLQLFPFSLIKLFYNLISSLCDPMIQAMTYYVIWVARPESVLESVTLAPLFKYYGYKGWSSSYGYKDWSSSLWFLKLTCPHIQNISSCSIKD